jgi:hypothetical protein
MHYQIVEACHKGRKSRQWDTQSIHDVSYDEACLHCETAVAVSALILFKVTGFNIQTLTELPTTLQPMNKKLFFTWVGYIGGGKAFHQLFSCFCNVGDGI